MNNMSTSDWIRSQKTSTNPYISIENIKKSLNQNKSSVFGDKVVLSMLDVCTVLKLSVDLSDSMIMMTGLLKECEKFGVFEKPELKKYKKIITQIIDSSNASS